MVKVGLKNYQEIWWRLIFGKVKRGGEIGLWIWGRRVDSY